MKARLLGLSLLAFLAAQPAVSQDAALLSCPPPGAPVSEPYRWYPALDLARVPFHHADGPWGPRAPIVAPAPPVIRNSVRAASAAQVVAAAKVPGTQITIDAAYIGRVVLFGNVSDIDIVVPPNRTVAELWVGSAVPPSSTRRVRIRGTTSGMHSGGVVGRIVFHSDVQTDLIVDGVDLNGNDGEGGHLLLQFRWGVERVAVTNTRGHGVGPLTVGGGDSVVFAGNRFMSGAREPQANGYPEGWGIRSGGRVIVFDNRIEGNRYHRVRVHPGQAQRPEYAWVANNVFVDPHEARILDASETTGRMPDTRYAAIWGICNQVYAHSKCVSPTFDAPDADYARMVSNTFYGSFTERQRRVVQKLHGAGRDYLSGNTFLPWQPPPPWTAPGNPRTEVLLPPLKPERYKASLAFPNCPPP